MLKNNDLMKKFTTRLGSYGLLIVSATILFPLHIFADTPSQTQSEHPVLSVDDKTAIQTQNITLHVGDSWGAYDNILSLTDKGGNLWTSNNIAHHIGDIEFSVTTANTAGILEGGKVVKAGRFNVTYWYGSNPEKSVSANVTVIPVVNFVVKDSTIYTGDKWMPEDNFVGGSEDGIPIDFSKVTVTGTVDTSKAGVYPITYHYYDKSDTINVIVKTNQTAITVRDITLHVGDSWDVYDNITGYIDKDGVHHSWSPTDFNDINRLGFSTSSSGDPDIWDAKSGKVIKAGKFVMTYKFVAAQGNPESATITVLP